MVVLAIETKVRVLHNAHIRLKRAAEQNEDDERPQEVRRVEESVAVGPLVQQHQRNRRLNAVHLRVSVARLTARAADGKHANAILDTSNVRASLSAFDANGHFYLFDCVRVCE